MATVTSNDFLAQHLKFVPGSEFYDQLDIGGKQRYRQKLQLLGICCDPYATKSEEWECNPDLWPNVEFPDICAYLIESSSPHTKESLKAYKSTDAWAYFIAGYVTDVGRFKINSCRFLPSSCMSSNFGHP